jgi:very-short-patch-repair endonuclease
MVNNNKLRVDNDKIKELRLKKQKEIEKNIIDFSSKNNVRVAF